MARLSIEIDLKDGKQVGRALVASFNKGRARVIHAMHEAAHQVSEQIIAEGRSDISSAGNFGERWVSGLQSAEDLGAEIALVTIFHTVPYWRVFEVGATIHGKPLLWIPLSFSDAVGKTAREYGGLFRVDRKVGRPLLLSVQDKKPKFFGIESVTIPKKFHLTEISRRVAGKLRQFFKAAFAAGK